ncbi:hypothetical protein NSK_000857 [Nannochloropsis salina CCMP1776]|uniref:BolA-like protein n=1 Tax=Nannochloropsis salina CCMP1776 TaxID=1027361 RepID=A0A4D9DD85_9STRA|nr:hypothetical protein NSK_000857 [Nannochloropsis salina CCMP1776]|eukprot:TFJ87505.1 hypothetical protein NSK_000857 [Nannochloropsis salina CCMP1776]
MEEFDMSATPHIITPAQIQSKLTEALQAVFVEAKDMSDGCGAKFEILTVSPTFEGKSLLQRHRAVNAALAKELEHIHAITLKCLTPTQWDETKKCQPDT